MIDCHSHLADEAFNADIDDVIKDAQDTGVKACLVTTISADDFPRTVELSEKYPSFIVPCFGIHPVQGVPGNQRSVLIEDLDKAFDLMEKYQDKMVAVGEIGLDFTPRFCTADDSKDIQREVFRRQIEFGKKYDLPVNVHSRSAGRPTVQFLKDMGASNVLLHAFDGKPSVAMEGVQLGYYFSIPPCIARSEQKQQLVAKIPIENIVLETDSPSLGPVKEGRNVPANLSVSVDFIAKIKNLDVEFVKKVTTENALKVFPKLKRFVVL